MSFHAISFHICRQLKIISSATFGKHFFVVVVVFFFYVLFLFMVTLVNEENGTLTQ